MIIVRIQGGLGNQMFQYAYAKTSSLNGFDVKLDISNFETYKLHGGYWLDKYSIDLKIASKNEIGKVYKNRALFQFWNRTITKKIRKEKSLSFDTSMQDIKDGTYAYGYFQTERYFLHIRNIILLQFVIKNENSKYTDNMANKIMSLEVACSLHIRRGDYVSDRKSNKIHGVCDLEYYKKAMKILNDKYENITYIVFSDDIAWSKENLASINMIYVDSKENRMPHEDIYLMSLCQHNIIANSSFSWWGAWLNTNDKKTILAPKIWFTDETKNKLSDIVCPKWKRI